VYVHTPGEVDSFNMHCSALTAAAICWIWGKLVNNFQSYSTKNFWLTILWT